MSAERADPALTARSVRVRSARQLTAARFRRARGEFLAEGPQAVREAVASGTVVEVFVERSSLERRAAEVGAAQRAGLTVHVVDDAGFAGLVTAQTPQGIVATCGWSPISLADLIALVVADPAGRQIVLAHEMADPGNAGAVIRVADAAGAAGVALSDASVDPTNPKCVRSSAGSVFHLPVVQAGRTTTAIGALRASGFRVLAADISADALDLFTAERTGLLRGRVAWLLGNEAHGLPEDVLSAADHVVGIPLLGRAESLNVATAAAVCLYAHARLREESG